MRAAPATTAVMKVTKTPIPELLLLEPRVFSDQRGFFLESFNERAMAEIGITAHFVQDNHSYSTHGVLRGLHYQLERPQGKLVRAVGGEILDVAVDLRRRSPTLGQWFATLLSGENQRMLWIPPGFAHGFHVRSDSVHVLYKATDFFAPESERTIAWNDLTLNIAWQLKEPPVVSAKDAHGVSFEQAPKFD